jgi:hypothetical protein
VLGNGGFEGIGNKPAFDLVLDIGFETLGDNLFRRFAGTKAGKAGFALEFAGNFLKSFLDLFLADFHTHQFFAGTQIFYRYIHKQTFRFKRPGLAVRELDTLSTEGRGVKT